MVAPAALRETPPGNLAIVAAQLLARLIQEFPLGYVPELEWRNFRVTAGVAYYRAGRIALSRQVITDEDSLVVTLKHEYAHLLAVNRNGPRAAGHGPAWRTAMVELGLEPKVRHNYDVARNKPRQRVIYECLKCRQLIVKARKFPRKRAYLHVACGGPIRFKRVESVTVSNPVA